MSANADIKVDSNCEWFSTMQVGQTRIKLVNYAEVNQINPIITFFEAHQEIVWFDISMNNVLAMNMLETTDELIDNHQHGFQRERAAAETQKIGQTWPKQFRHHVIIFPIFTVRINARNADTTGEFLNSHDFRIETWIIDCEKFEFDRNLSIGLEINCFLKNQYCTVHTSALIGSINRSPLFS